MANDSASSPKPQKTEETFDAGHVPMTEEMDSARRNLPPIIPVLIAFAVVAIIVGIYSYSARPGVEVQANIVGTRTFPIHTESAKMMGPTGMEGEAEKYDQMIVMAHVNVKNLGQKRPVYIKGVEGKISTGTDQGDLEATQAAGSDQKQFFGYYKQVADFQMDPLQADTKLNPGQDVTGNVMFSFPVTPDVWQKRKDFTVTINLYDRNPIVLHFPQGT
jgi:hypothetical protein